MRIAAIYWPTSSVGGINSVLVALRKAAIENGDTFDVIRCGNQKTITPSKFPTEELIRGGDTFITIHGECSHHPDQVEGTIRWLEANFDALYFAYMCPHSTKAYGDEPVFMPIYTQCKLPKVTFIPDAYWDTYADWAIPCLPHVKKTLVTQAPYAEPLLKMGMPVEKVDVPIFPVAVKSKRSETPLVVWTSQWKNIKGINKLMPYIPAISEVATVEMYSNGILYYQIRETEEWKAAINKDHFKGFDGHGKADFFGYIPLDQIPEVLTRSWYMIDLQGIGRPKHEAYRNGAYNYTTIEALLYGSCPILHSQAQKSIIPKEFFLFVDDPKDIAELVKTKVDFALNPRRQELAMEWVMETHSGKGMYKNIREAFSMPDPNVDISKFLKPAESGPIDLFSMF